MKTIRTFCTPLPFQGDRVKAFAIDEDGMTLATCRSGNVAFAKLDIVDSMQLYAWKYDLPEINLSWVRNPPSDWDRGGES